MNKMQNDNRNREKASRIHQSISAWEAEAMQSRDQGQPAQKASPDSDDGQTVINREAFSAVKHGRRAVESHKSPTESGEQINYESKVYDCDYQNEEILKRQESLRFSLLIRMLTGLFLALVLCWLDVAAVYGYPLPPFVSFSDHYFYFIGVNAVLLALTAVAGFPVVAPGIASLFTFGENSNSITALAFLGALAGNVGLLFVPVSGHVAVYSSAAAMCIALSLLGKYLNVKRVIRNIQYASGQHSFYSLDAIDDYDTAVSLSRGVAADTPFVCTTEKTRFLDNFIEHSYSCGPKDKAARILAPVAFLAALAAAGGVYFVKKDLSVSLIAFSTICCVGSPVLFELGNSLPFYRAGKKLNKKKAMITGYEAIDDFSLVNVVVAEDNMLFPAGSVTVHGIKTFSGYKIEQAILNAASIVSAANSPLAPAFLSLIEQDGKSLLKKVDGLSGEDEMGICSWIENQRMLLGNRELMRRYGVDAPSRDYEAKYLGEGRDLIYFAVGGLLSAMFILEYNSHKEVAAAVRRLQRCGVSLLVKTFDPNINSTLLSDKLKINYGSVKIMSTKERELLNSQFSDTAPSSDAEIAFSEGFRSYSDAVISAIKLRGTFSVCNFLQIFSAVLGIFFMIFTSFTSGINEITPVHLLAYQLLWAVPVLLINLMRKH
ncbi:MAG TPA: hypothetical protein VHR42_05775 [Clostridia bacterium]|nr:hypothetical protein [Clostridia bacterium]